VRGEWDKAVEKSFEEKRPRFAFISGSVTNLFKRIFWARGERGLNLELRGRLAGNTVGFPVFDWGITVYKDRDKDSSPLFTGPTTTYYLLIRFNIVK
jgi:hypothetical protein